MDEGEEGGEMGREFEGGKGKWENGKASLGDFWEKMFKMALLCKIMGECEWLGGI
jgi:hypothetical protein